MSSTEFKDYYNILGVEKTADTREIKKNFRQLALKYHPDRNQGKKAAEHEVHEPVGALGAPVDPEGFAAEPRVDRIEQEDEPEPDGSRQVRRRPRERPDQEPRADRDREPREEFHSRG